MSYKICLANLRLVQRPLAVCIVSMELGHACLSNIYSYFTHHNGDKLVAKITLLNDGLAIGVNFLV